MKIKRSLILISALVLILSSCGANESATVLEEDSNPLISESELEEDSTSSESSPSQPSDPEINEKDLIQNPSELMEIVNETNSYSLQLQYNTWETQEEYKVKYSEYDYSSDTQLEKYVELSSSVLLDIFVTKDAIRMDKYIYSNGEYKWSEEQVVYNVGNSYYTYTTTDLENWSSSFRNGYTYQEILYTLMYAYEMQVQNYFDFLYSDTDSYGDTYDKYGITNQTRINYFFMSLSTEYIFDRSALKDISNTYFFGGIYFYKLLQLTQVDFYIDEIVYEDEDINDDTLVYYSEQDVIALIYDVGQTTDNGYCESIHNKNQNID